jgi:hypothetical protein
MGKQLGLITLCAGLATLAAESARAEQPKIRVVIIDGQNNHDWKATTPLMKKVLEDCGRFSVAVSTAPGKDGNRRQ